MNLFHDAVLMTDRNLHHPHDSFAKRGLTQPEIARDLLQAHLPKALQALCNLDTLRIEPSNHIEEELKQIFSDVIYSLEIKGERGYIFVLLEHQSREDELLAYRLLRYQMAFFKRYLDEGHQKLPLAIPMVIYHGPKSPYSKGLGLSDCFADPILAKEWMFKDFHLIDLTVIDDNEILQHKRAALMEMVQRHIFRKNIMEVVESIKQALSLAKTYPTLQGATQDMIYYLLNQANYPERGSLFEALTEPSSTYREDAMTAGEELRHEGRQEGHQEGRLEGRQEGRYETQQALTQRMLAAGLSKELVEQIIHPEIQHTQNS